MKKRLRSKLMKLRDAISPEIKLMKETRIGRRLMDLDSFMESRCLLMYASFRSEVDTGQYLEHVLSMGKRLVLPVVDARHNILKLYEVTSLTELAPGYMGIPEPEIRENRRVDLGEIDLVIIPGTGFDVNGNRLGYGGGYYDRLLSLESKELAGADHIKTIALAFEEQIGDTIPSEPHDITVDIIVTDERTIHC